MACIKDTNHEPKSEQHHILVSFARIFADILQAKVNRACEKLQNILIAHYFVVMPYASLDNFLIVDCVCAIISL